MPINTIDEILDDFRQGKMVLIMDDESRENEGDLIIAADVVTPETVTFFARHACGLICLPITEERGRQLNLPLMVEHNSSMHETNFTVSIEAADGISTGISAADRAKTVRDAVGQALDLGAEMIGITGGEPFFREDIFDLYELVLSESHRSVTTLTNGTRLKGKVLERLKEVADDRVELRISLDGPNAEVNDRIRGNGSFKGAVRGIKNAQQTDCRVTVTMATPSLYAGVPAAPTVANASPA